jgi:hypothetical protein
VSHDRPGGLAASDGSESQSPKRGSHAREHVGRTARLRSVDRICFQGLGIGAFGCFQCVPELPKDRFAAVPQNVVVADTGNYYPRQRDGRIAEIEAGLPESRWVERQLRRPGIKAFNNIYAI